MRTLTLTLCVLWTSIVFAGLPTGMSQSDLDRLVELLGPPAVTRLFRSAETYELFPGMRMAIEVNFIPTASINTLGDRNGTFAGVNPTPRFSFTKGLAAGFEFQINYFPENIMNVLSTLGGAIKWTIFEERERQFSGAVFGSYTSLSGFDKTFTGKDVEFGMVISKDLVTVRPFMGAGLIFGHGEVPSNYAALSTVRSGSYFTVHSFFGCEILLPATLAFQVELMNLSPMISMMVGWTL